MSENATLTSPLTVSGSPPSLRGSIRVPGDKSISHRAIMLASLASGHTKIDGLLEGEDVMSTAGAMRALGAHVEKVGASWHVRGSDTGTLCEPNDVLNMGNSGTSARLLSGILATQPFTSVLTGDASLRRRPMRRVTDPLEATTARFFSREGGKLPLTIVGTQNAKAVTYVLPMPSAQVKSALLLSGLRAEGTTRVEEPIFTRDHTENMLRHFGVEVKTQKREQGGHTITMDGPVKLVARDILVPSDPSSAAFPLVAALILPHSEVTLLGVGLNPSRIGLLTTLREMGAKIRVQNERTDAGEPIGDLFIEASRLHNIDVPASRAPSMIDEYPILAVACSFAQGQARLRGLDELRVKESDRLAATYALLTSNGVSVRIEGDDLVIDGHGGGAGLGGGQVQTNMDHRIAMSAIVFGLAAEKSVAIDDTAFIETSFPNFIGMLNSLGAHL